MPLVSLRFVGLSIRFISEKKKRKQFSVSFMLIQSILGARDARKVRGRGRLDENCQFRNEM